jgi:spore maturation protein CgeB
LLCSAQVKIVILGFPTRSRRGNVLAATNRNLVRELEARGHEVLFLERGASGSSERRKTLRPKDPQTRVYRSVSELKSRYAPPVREAHVVIVGSFAPEGADVGQWVTRVAKGVTASYDDDTSETLARLEHGAAHPLTRSLVPKYDLYLSVTGGPALEKLQKEYRAPMARELKPQDSAAHRAAQLERYVAEAMTGQLMA